jgi:hypothetical protein
LSALAEDELTGVDEEDGDCKEAEDDAHEHDVAHASGIPRLERQRPALTQLLR